jgi:hypothetical protein
MERTTLRQAYLEQYLENLGQHLKESTHEELHEMRCLPELDFVLQTWSRYLGAERTVNFTGFQLRGRRDYDPSRAVKYLPTRELM